MKLDTRNPFAAWGFEQEVYGVQADEDNGILEYTDDVKGFVNETVVDDAYNKVAEPMNAEDYSEQHTGQMSFFTNNENMLPSALETKAYGEKQELQREYPAGEPLNYYGNEADDLHIYGDPEEGPVIPSDYEKVDNPEDIPTEDTEEIKVALVGDDAVNAMTGDNYYKELMVAEANVSSSVKYNAVDKLTVDTITVSGAKDSSNGKIIYTAPVVEIKNVTVDKETETTVYNMFEGAQSTNDNYDGLHELNASKINIDNPGLTHNVINVYTPADNAVITIKDSKFNLNANNSNVIRLANYLNAKNVVVNFENIEWTYEDGTPEGSDWSWAGLAIYQPASNDHAINGDCTEISTWTINVKNCKYNGVKVTANTIGEHNQVIYAYGVNKQNVVIDPAEIGITINFA
jgi:hypothetical protein